MSRARNHTTLNAVTPWRDLSEEKKMQVLVDTTTAPQPGRYSIDPTTTRVYRTDFGVTAYRGLAGRDLDITIEIRAALGATSDRPSHV
jgi:hypothetical protein